MKYLIGECSGCDDVVQVTPDNLPKMQEHLARHTEGTIYWVDLREEGE